MMSDRDIEKRLASMEADLHKGGVAEGSTARYLELAIAYRQMMALESISLKLANAFTPSVSVMHYDANRRPDNWQGRWP